MKRTTDRGKSNIIPFRTKRKPRDQLSSSMPILDMVLRGDRKFVFHPEHRFDTTISVPTARCPKKIGSGSRIICTFDRDGKGKIVQFLVRSVRKENGMASLSGKVITDYDIAPIDAINVVKQNLETIHR